MARSEEIIRERYKVMAPRIIKALNQRNFEAYFCETSQEAVECALSLIPEGASVSWGGSMTLDEIGIKEQLKKGNYQLLDRDLAKSQEERQAIMRQVFSCDVYLSSVNAMSEDGVMVNIDGMGNRISAIAFGPKAVILVVGMNKVCRDLESARKRAHTYAAPNNAIRLGLELPCTKTGCCFDCNNNNARSICAQIVEMHSNMIPGRIKVILVGENLGL
ncbi:MAG TPA: lactate utilization protein [Acetivibrio sp.]|uniref:lactate utilization protein n=1 Tax=Acetivibrio sp. TaxID=1872092 RepID=UPI002BDBE754|nr:lactate utilization protein [Acetivibrio sp.]HOM02730.1 lactate utilization protein [Acetivibrio sp.]